jgi:hypothetical protein
MLNTNSVLSKEGNSASLSPNPYRRVKRRSFFVSPMVPIDENMSDQESPVPSSNMGSNKPKFDRAQVHEDIKISPFEPSDGKAMNVSPSLISTFSTSKGTKCKLSTSSRYKYELEDDSDDSSSIDDSLSYEEGRSENPYADVCITGMSKEKLLKLRCKTIFLTRAPVKPRPCKCIHPESCEDSDDSD